MPLVPQLLRHLSVALQRSLHNAGQGTHSNQRKLVMIHTWQIYVDDKFRATVKSMTEQGAIDFWFMHFGSASKYTGIGRDQIRAVKI